MISGANTRKSTALTGAVSADKTGTKSVARILTLPLRSLNCVAQAQAIRNLAMAMVLAVLALFGSTDHADAKKMRVSIQSSTYKGVSLPGVLHRPDLPGARPAVVLMHGCGGWQNSVFTALEDHAETFRKQGFVVLNLDSFTPRGKQGGMVCESYSELKRARRYRVHDAFDALGYLEAQDFVDSDNIFLVGQSNGGSVAMIAALQTKMRHSKITDNKFRGVVALYPWCGAAGTTRLSLESPLLILGGGKDDWVPPKKCTRFKASGAGLAVKVYNDAVHSFDVKVPVQRFKGKLVGYHREAALDSRKRMLEFFQSNIVSGEQVSQLK